MYLKNLFYIYREKPIAADSKLASLFKYKFFFLKYIILILKLFIFFR